MLPGDAARLFRKLARESDIELGEIGYSKHRDALIVRWRDRVIEVSMTALDVEVGVDDYIRHILRLYSSTSGTA